MTAQASAPSATRRLGRTELQVTPVGVGGSPIGGMERLYGHDTSHQDGVETALRALTGPFTLLDTSNAYSEGRSEERIGQAIERLGGVPDGFVLATKVDADPHTGRFDRDRVLRSFDESVQRLGVETVSLLHLHDPEGFISLREALAEDGAIAGLLELRASGQAGAIGIAGGAAAEMAAYVESGHFDVLLTHNRFTLVDRTADRLIDLAVARDMGVINAAPFGGGVLARKPREDDRYAYGMGSAQQVVAAVRMQAYLDAEGIPLAAAALQFSVRDPRIHSTLVGASTPARVDRAAQLLTVDIPDRVWGYLDTLVPPTRHWIND